MTIFYYFHKLEKLWSPTRATLTNPSFQYFSELGKRLKYSLRPKHKNPNFESKDELENNLRIRVSLLKIKGIYIKQGWWYFKLNGWNIQGIFHWKPIGKNQFSILKNRILNPLEILCIPQNIWLLERPYWLDYI